MPKVLVIDDNQNLQKLARVNLAARGYEVLTADTGEDGLRLAQIECPALILLDLMLPDISGWEVIATLRHNRKLEKTPVIIMTASVRKGDSEKAQGIGAVSYLAKPFAIDELLRRVKLATGKRG